VRALHGLFNMSASAGSQVSLCDPPVRNDHVATPFSLGDIPHQETIMQRILPIAALGLALAATTGGIALAQGTGTTTTNTTLNPNDRPYSPRAIQF